MSVDSSSFGAGKSLAPVYVVRNPVNGYYLAGARPLDGGGYAIEWNAEIKSAQRFKLRAAAVAKMAEWGVDQTIEFVVL